MDIFTIKQWLFLLILAECGMMYLSYRILEIVRIILVDVSALLKDVKGHE